MIGAGVRPFRTRFPQRRCLSVLSDETHRVIAAAEHSSADRLITTDRTWPTAKVLKLTVSIEQI